jgi:putative transposase
MNGPNSACDCGTIARSRPHYGYQRLYVLLRREGWLVNRKLVYRVYCEEDLGIQRKRPRRRKSCQVRQARSSNAGPNDSWSMDFLSDQPFSGRRYRVSRLVDNFSRESLEIRAGQRLTGNDVVQTVNAFVKSRGAKPVNIRVDKGTEYNSKSLDLWTYWNGVKQDFSRPGKRTDNALIESFKGKFRAECLHKHWFMSLDEAKCVFDLCRDCYNRHRPRRLIGQPVADRVRDFSNRGSPRLETLIPKPWDWTKLGERLNCTLTKRLFRVDRAR